MVGILRNRRRFKRQDKTGILRALALAVEEEEEEEEGWEKRKRTERAVKRTSGRVAPGWWRGNGRRWWWWLLVTGCGGGDIINDVGDGDYCSGDDQDQTLGIALVMTSSP